MRLKKSVLNKINTLDVRLKLASALQFSETWIRELIRQNKENGPLTTFKALEVIREETGLSDDQLLVDNPVPSL
jgi:hypothetical protein